MAITHNILRQYTDQSGRGIQMSEQVSENAEFNIEDLAVPIVANKNYVWAVVRSKLRSLCFYSDVALSIFTNAASSGSPDDTIVLVAGQTLVWTLAADGLARCPLTTNVSSIYVTNGTAGLAQLKIRCILHQ